MSTLKLENIKHENSSTNNMVMDSDGSVSTTGNASVGGTLGVTGAVTASSGLTVDDNGGTPLTIDRAQNDGRMVAIQRDGSTVASIGVVASNNLYLNGDTVGLGIGDDNLYATNNAGAASDATLDIGDASVRFRDTYLSGGIYLGGTGAANKLDDYEEGTWTPTITGGGTFTVANATYTKIGKLVYAGFYASNVTGVSSSGSLYITLPFTVSPSNNYHAAGAVSYTRNSNWAQYAISGPTPYSGSASMYFHKLNGSASSLTNSEFQIMVNEAFIMGLVYHTDD